jgi:hypothetical protein
MLSDLDIDFYTVIAKTWTPDEAEGWTQHAERVESGAVERPSLSSLPRVKSWLEDWKERGRPVACDCVPGLQCGQCEPKGS